MFFYIICDILTYRRFFWGKKGDSDLLMREKPIKNEPPELSGNIIGKGGVLA